MSHSPHDPIPNDVLSEERTDPPGGPAQPLASALLPFSGLAYYPERPEPTTALALDLVVDQGGLVALHQRQIARLYDAFTALDAFSDIRVHLFTAHTNAPLRITRQPTEQASRLLPDAFNEGGPRLIVVVTDGVGDGWHRRSAQQALVGWGRRHPVAVLQLLPQYQWVRTGLRTMWATVHSAGSAAANGAHRCAEATVPLPVLSLETRPLRAWSRFIMGLDPQWRGTVADLDPAPAAAEPPADPPTAAEAVARFRAAVTPTAYELAVHLAATPLTGPLMDLVQREMLPLSSPSDLSQFLGSGLVRHTGEPIDREKGVAFEFAIPAIRAELLSAGRRSQTQHVLKMVTAFLAEHDDAFAALPDLVSRPGGPPPALAADVLPLLEPLALAFAALGGAYCGSAGSLSRARTEAGRDDQPVAAIAASSEENDDAALALKPRNAEPGRDSTSPMPETVDVQNVAAPPALKPAPLRVAAAVRGIPPAGTRIPTDPPPVWGNVPPRNASFTGREDLLEQLSQRLLGQGPAAVLPEALHGMGGVGKSQLAIEYVYRNFHAYDVVWWIAAERTGKIQQGLAELAASLDLPVSQEVNVAIPAVLEALRLGRPYANWLLVFDNAEHIDEVREFFPTNGPGKVLVTSRNHRWSSVANALEIDVFDRAESLDLLRLRGPELAAEDANALADVLGDLPLAIEQAAVWLAETGMPASEYLQIFREKHDQAAELLGANTASSYELPVAAAWNVSLERLQETDKAALQLLQVCAFFAPEPISRRWLAGARDLDGPEELVQALGDPVRFNRATRSINQYGLAKISHRHNSLLMHRLVQRVIVGQLPDDQVEALRRCGHQLLTKADPNAPDQPVHWPLYAELLPHALYSDLVESDAPWGRQLILNLIEFLFLWGDHQGFLDLAQKAVEVWTARLGPDDPQTLAAGLHLGQALRFQGDATKAYEVHTSVRDALLAARGPEDERTLEAQQQVTIDLRYLGEFGRALELDTASLETLRRKFGHDDPTTLWQAFLVAIDLRLTGDPAGALDLDLDTYRRMVVVYGEDYHLTLSCLGGIAIDEIELGRFDAAVERIRDHVQRARRVLGPASRGLASGLAVMSVAERKAGRHARALELSTEALSMFQGRYGPTHAGSVATALNHAVNLLHAGRVAESIELARKSVTAFEQFFGSNHPNTPAAHVNLAVALRTDGRVDEALDLDTAALATLVELLGPDHPRSMICAVNLASDHFLLGDFETALHLDEQTLERLVAVFGEDHPTTLACAVNLSLDLRSVNRIHEAETRLADTLTRLRASLGDTHPATVSAAESRRAECDIYPVPL